MKLDFLKQKIKPSNKKLAGIGLSLFLALSDSYADNLSLDFLYNNGKVGVKKSDITFKPSKDITQVPFLGKKDIYIAIDGKPYGEYQWFDNNGYILVNHRDGKKPLKFIKGNNYNIVVPKDIDVEVDDEKTINNIKNLFIKYQKEKISDKLKQKVSSYIEKIESAIGKQYKNRYLTFIDTKKNKLFLVYSDKNGNIQILGASKVSTGNPKRGKGYFNTPYIVIDRQETGFYKKDWRALGTDAKGYGDKGRRIFFLGKYFVNIKTREPSLDLKNGYDEIHLAFHTTTPWGLTQLGKPMSRGCIRTDVFINKLYDKFNKINEGVFILGDINKKINYYFNKDKIEELVLDDKEETKIASSK